LCKFLFLDNKTYIPQHPLTQEFNEGKVLLINKPAGWTSFDVVGKIRNVSRAKKEGHAGTLDPLATGLVILCTGKFTKRIDEFQAQEKEYTGTITLGATRPSYDLETEIDQTFEWEHITPEMVQAAAKQFTGIIEQIPPSYSAIKVDGKRSYKAAREGKPLELKSRQVEVTEFEITGIELPNVHFRVVCSKGTYIRTLAFDFGRALGSGAYLAALCRTRIGEFLLKDAVEVEDFVREVKDIRNPEGNTD
jgi:tRNA pseudouridine55 synthase